MKHLPLSAVTLIFLFAFTDVGAVHAQGVPGVDANNCLAGKTKCVSKRVAGLLKCRANCQKKPDKCGQAQTDCETKVMDKFDGGLSPGKGCFAKLEAKENLGKPKTVCTITGDTATVETAVDGYLAEILGRLEGTCDGLGGVEFGGACWFYAGVDNTGCDTTCTNVGLGYDEATRTFAGSDGTGQNCLDVMTALGELLQTGDLSSNCAEGFGCYNNVGAPLPTTNRCTDPATTAAAGPGPFGGLRRACACH